MNECNNEGMPLIKSLDICLYNFSKEARSTRLTCPYSRLIHVHA